MGTRACGLLRCDFVRAQSQAQAWVSVKKLRNPPSIPFLPFSTSYQGPKASTSYIGPWTSHCGS